MRRRSRLLLIVMLIVSLTALVGCSGKGTTSGAQTESATEAEEPRSVLVGTISGIEDNTFTVTDQDGIPYDFPFEGDAPDGLDDVSEGDYVKVIYTGDLSETDGFDGEVVSVEQQ